MDDFGFDGLDEDEAYVIPGADGRYLEDGASQTRRADANSAFNQLSAGRTLGKRVVVDFTPIAFGGAFVQPSPVNMLELRGEDKYAMQVALTLSPPKVIVAPAPPDLQSATGEVDNTGTLLLPVGYSFANPVVIAEWGIGGVSNRVEADFANGLVLNLSASFLRISAFVDAQVQETTVRSLYVLSAFVGPGFAKANNAQRTQVNFPTGNIFPTPAYAKTVVVTGATFVAPTWSARITFFRDTAGAQPMAQFVFGDGTAAAGGINRPIDVPNGGYYWRITRLYAGAGVDNTTFDLAV